MNTQQTQSRRRVLLGALGLMAFVVSKIPAATPVPENVDWVLVEMNGHVVESKGVTLKLDAAKSLAHGKSFVNNYHGKYELKDATLMLGAMATTRMGGPPQALALEREYLAALAAVTGWRLADGKLELLAIDKVVLRFSEKAEAKK